MFRNSSPEWLGEVRKELIFLSGCFVNNVCHFFMLLSMKYVSLLKNTSLLDKFAKIQLSKLVFHFWAQHFDEFRIKFADNFDN